jgi:hypothetical protein
MDINTKNFYLHGYKLLTKKNPKFPNKFTIDMKINLYNCVMNHYKDEENYEYCTKLSQSLNNIKNESNN